MTLSWGIAATGRIARTVGTVIAEHPDMRLAAVGSRDAGRAEALARDLGAARAHGSYEALLRDPAVDAVYVATPHAQHADVVVPALEAGTAVLCEKPLTHRLSETERLARTARETGTFLMEGMWMRFNPLVQQLSRLVRDGALGELRSLTAALGFPAPYDPGGRLWAPELGGGALLDLGVYTVDLARLLLGDPSEVVAGGSLAATGVDAESSVLLSFPSGAHAVLSHSLLTRMPTTALLLGSRGWAELSASFYAPTRLVVQVGDAEPELHEIPDRRAGFVGELEEVARCVAAGRGQSEVMPLSESVATARVLDAALAQLQR
jgi:predicted dehydrogenase